MQRLLLILSLPVSIEGLLHQFKGHAFRRSYLCLEGNGVLAVGRHDSLAGVHTCALKFRQL